MILFLLGDIRFTLDLKRRKKIRDRRFDKEKKEMVWIGGG